PAAAGEEGLRQGGGGERGAAARGERPRGPGDQPGGGGNVRPGVRERGRMSDEPALLRAIVDDPEDIPLRLVYADWCEEHGRAARAALIRGQCALDGVLLAGAQTAWYRPRDPRCLSARDLPLLLREDVLAPFRADLEATGHEWQEKGFLSSENA